MGTFSTTDADVGDTFTYTLVAGATPTDNSSFTILGNMLKIATPFDYEAKSAYTVRVRSADSGGLFMDKSFVITVTNLNDAPQLDTTSSPTLATSRVNSGPPVAGSVQGSTLVSAVIGGSPGIANYFDNDGNPPGIAITGMNLGFGGRLWYTTNDGAEWQEITRVADTFATLLYADSSTRLHFMPSGGFSGTISDVISFRAWDRTGGYANGTTGINTHVNYPNQTIFPAAGEAFGLTLSADGRHAFVADGGSGLQVIDITDAASTVRVAGIDTPGSARRVKTSTSGYYYYYVS